MPPRGRAGKKKAAPRRQIDDEADDDLEGDEELLALDQNNMPGNDQEELTQEEKDVMHIKVLTSKNPQAAHNITKFHWHKRCFETEAAVDQMVFHYSVEGNILLSDSLEARDQEEYLEKKKNHDNMLLNKINKAIKEANIKVPRK